MKIRRSRADFPYGLTRRELFRTTTAAAFLSMGALDTRANPLGLPIGCQTYPVRHKIATDFPGTIQLLAAAGFQTIELCSPQGYAKAGFAAVAQYKGAALPRLLGNLNVKCQSSYFSMRELREDLPGRIAWAQEVGLTQMLVPSLSGPRHPTLDEVKRVAEEFNHMARQTAQAGLQMGLHNEDFELSQIGGRRTYDVLFDLLDPQLVKFQFQCSTISEGLVAADYFTRYPGRFLSMHVQDWSPEAKREVAVGQGSIDWKKTFTAAKTGGIKNYFVEMDLDLMKASVPYLRNLQV